jgi:hypothetical protein
MENRHEREGRNQRRRRLLKEEMNEHGKSPESQRKAQEGRSSQ